MQVAGWGGRDATGYQCGTCAGTTRPPSQISQGKGRQGYIHIHIQFHKHKEVWARSVSVAIARVTCHDLSPSPPGFSLFTIVTHAPKFAGVGVGFSLRLGARGLGCGHCGPRLRGVTCEGGRLVESRMGWLCIDLRANINMGSTHRSSKEDVEGPCLLLVGDERVNRLGVWTRDAMAQPWCARARDGEGRHARSRPSVAWAARRPQRLLQRGRMRLAAGFPLCMQRSQAGHITTSTDAKVVSNRSLHATRQSMDWRVARVVAVVGYRRVQTYPAVSVLAVLFSLECQVLVSSGPVGEGGPAWRWAPLPHCVIGHMLAFELVGRAAERTHAWLQVRGLGVL